MKSPSDLFWNSCGMISNLKPYCNSCKILDCVIVINHLNLIYLVCLSFYHEILFVDTPMHFRYKNVLLNCMNLHYATRESNLQVVHKCVPTCVRKICEILMWFESRISAELYLGNACSKTTHRKRWRCKLLIWSR